MATSNKTQSANNRFCKIVKFDLVSENDRSNFFHSLELQLVGQREVLKSQGRLECRSEELLK